MTFSSKFYVYDHNRRMCIFCPDFFCRTLQLPRQAFTSARLFIAGMLMAMRCCGRLTTPHDLTRQPLTDLTTVNHGGDGRTNIGVHRALPTVWIIS